MATGLARAGGVMKSTGARRKVALDKNSLGRESIQRVINSRQETTPTSDSKQDSNQATTPQKGAIIFRAGERLQRKTGQEESADSGQEGEGAEVSQFLEMEEAYNLNESYNQEANYLRRQLQTLSNNRPLAKARKPFSGVGFYGTLIIVAVKDVLDVIIQIVEFFGAVTIVVGVVFFLISAFLAFAVWASSNTLYMMEGVKPNSLQKKIKLSSIIGEVIPIIGALPLGTLALVIIAMTERKKAKEEAVAEQERLDTEWYRQQQALADQINNLTSA